MWVLHHETLSNDYKYKFRSLFYNLHNDNNTELRLSILTGGISACELPQFDSTQLAPKELTKLRDEREQKYIKEKLLLATNQNVGLLVIKSHKGEEIINIADSVESRADPTKIADLIRNEIGESVTNTGKKISANPSSSSPRKMKRTAPIAAEEESTYSYYSVSYTHLTLPTILLVQISVVAVSLKKKKKPNNTTYIVQGSANLAPREAVQA
eukprot:TRINITY_DN12579_c0_g1_i3.p1 TRINITY_DN12579_c0_g1~~TRINITY_DN12579_c0_g1_i3.p1  ORF type:complete len:212 (+),score=27.77 TRINITY_DN12579_c0_g1_i3:98-733(+)